MGVQERAQDNSELLKRALSAIDQLQAKLAEAEAAKHEPIAIVGMACRFPGAASPDELWSNLVAGVDSITVVPPSRWDAEAYYDPEPGVPGKAYTKWGGFIGDVERFDAAFFGITPREAVSLDPQQRMLLEMVWNALEDANIPASSIAGTSTSIFVGMSGMDFFQVLARTVGMNADSAYIASGTAHSIAGGRLSYFLGVHGPNVTVDTACSSSLVAVHLGVKSLRNREAEFAIAAGINLTLTPDPSILTSSARMMSPTGRCNTFDESADGYVRAEGCGVILMKRLSDALREGDRILALVRGTAVNQDGRSSGLTAPHGPSQEAVIRAALADGRVAPDDVTFVEAHGTGTALGDPIEVNALAKVFSRSADRPLVIGSVKANIGHTEAAAGIVGLIKAVQALRHRTMPKQIHLHKPNPMINWDASAIHVPLETETLTPPIGRTLICGVNSFGFSGTNAHAVLEEPPQPTPRAKREALPGESTLLAVSARTSDALNELAGRYADLLEKPDAPSFQEIAAAAPVSRSQFAERLGVVAASAAEAREALRAVAAGATAPNAMRARTLTVATPEIVFLFTGQGAQYAGMGRSLYESDAAFRGAIDACDAHAMPLIGRSLKDVMFGLNSTGNLVDDTTYTQPALFAIEYALAASWRSWGVEPTAVMGHSVGEYAAACVAGMLSLEDAMRLIVARGALMGALPREGAMAAVFAPEDVVRATIAPAGPRLSVAGVNGPANIVISGATDAVAEACEQFAQSGVETQRLNVSHAFHSALMDPILEEFEQVAGEMTLGEPHLTLISNISGARMGSEGRRPEYWRRHLRETVRFADSIAGLQRDGYRVFLELGPAPVLAGMAQRCGGKEPCAFIPSLRKGRDDRRSMLEAAGRLYAAGAQLNWTAIVGVPREHIELPLYPFQRQRYWPDGNVTGQGGLSGMPSGHPLLGDRVAAAVEMYQTRLGVARQPWARDHKLLEFASFPGAGFLEMGLAAARLSAGKNAELEHIVIAEGLILPDSGDVEVQVVVDADATGAKTVRIHSAAPPKDSLATEWRLHMSASIRAGKSRVTGSRYDEKQDIVELDVNKYYEEFAEAGAHYGPMFRGIRALKRQGGTLIAEIALPVGVSTSGYLLHPACLDACIQVMSALAKDFGVNLLMPTAATCFRVLQPEATAGVCRVALIAPRAHAKAFTANVTLLNAQGAVVAELLELEMRQITRASIEKMSRLPSAMAEWTFGVEWRLAEGNVQPDSIAKQNWLVFADRGGEAAAFVNAAQANGARCVTIDRPKTWDAKAVEAIVAKSAPIDQPLHGVALFWPLDSADDFAGCADLDQEMREQTTAALFALRAIVDRAARVLVMTCGAHCVGNRETSVVQAALWAFSGVVAVEHPTCGLTRVDLDPEGSGEHATALVREAAFNDREDRVAYRQGQRYLARLVPQTLSSPPDDAPIELQITERGSLANLAFVTAERCVPAEDQIEVRVRATGLSFRDVLNALGIYSDEVPFGVECTGIVTAVGDAVTRFKVGDEVVAMTERTFATYALANEALCVNKPPHLTHQQAATVPSSFLTAHYALTNLSQMKRGDRVFIHAVTGGLGMAAAQLALRAGAVVYGTAGTPAKRELAKRLGVHVVGNSRSLAFVDDIMQATGGKGVDIALNSLAGEFIPATLGLVRSGGSFVEVGRTDVWNAATVGRRFPGVHYHSLNLGEIARKDARLLRDALEEILAEMAPDGPLTPLPQTVFEFSQAEKAFRLMAQGLHTGKVVLTQHSFPRPRPDGVYVITGGLTGLGLATGQWLAQNGAGAVALLGRRAPSPEAIAAIQAIEQEGTRVHVAQVDVSDSAKLAKVLGELRSTIGPIRGIFHAAGIIDDGMLANQTPERIARVLAPKVNGGWALHQLTQSDPIDFFVLYSSAAALLGSPGQSNYAAANGFLDGLAAYRQGRGLPGLAINWGSWAEIGMAASVGDEHHRRWAAMGLETITPESGIEMLADLAMKATRPQMAAVPIVRSKFPSFGLGFYRELATGPAQAAIVEEKVDVLGALRAAAPDAQRAVMEAFVVDQVRRSLALPATQAVDVHELLLNLGLDSLMAMELRNRLDAAVGVRVAVADLLRGATTADLVRTLMTEVASGATAAVADPDPEREVVRL